MQISAFVVLKCGMISGSCSAVFNFYILLLGALNNELKARKQESPVVGDFADSLVKRVRFSILGIYIILK